MKKTILSLCMLFLCLTNVSLAQELNFSVTVNSKQVAGTDQRVYEALQEGMVNFLNNRIWTNVKFEDYERLEGAMVVTVKSKSGNTISADLNVVLRRPVFKSNYNTPLFNYIDNDFVFEYIESQPMDFTENSFTSNLTSTLAFYAYYCLGLYFDSFGPNGGDAFFKAAEAIVTAAQSATEPGWKAFDGNRNRYWLLENMTNTAYRPLRQYYYEYHRLGLDVMGNGKVDDGRTSITKSLDCVKNVFNTKPNLYFLQILCDTKRDEWKNIYSNGPQQEKTKAVNILRDIDASHAEEYEEILNAKPRL